MKKYRIIQKEEIFKLQSKILKKIVFLQFEYPWKTLDEFASKEAAEKCLKTQIEGDVLIETNWI